MEVTECGIHGFGEAIGIDVDELRFYWKLDIAAEYGRQQAYRLVVHTSRSAGATDHDDACFDSGRKESSEQRNILCKPEGGFKSTTLYYWTVSVWDFDGNTATSSPREFYTSYPRSSRLLPPYSMNQTYVSSSVSESTFEAFSF